MKYIIVLFALFAVAAAVGQFSVSNIPNPASFTLVKAGTYALKMTVNQAAPVSSMWTVLFNSTGLTSGTGLYLTNWASAKSNVNFTVSGVDAEFNIPQRKGVAVGYVTHATPAIGMKNLLDNSLNIKLPNAIGTAKITILITGDEKSLAQIINITVVDSLSSASTPAVAIWMMAAFAALISVIALF